MKAAVLFETKGSFATLSQVISAFITSLSALFLLLLIFETNFKYIVILLIVLNFLVEFKFLKFAMKYYKKLNLPIYILGIYAINFSIVIGALIGIFRLLSLKKLKISNK